MRKAVLVLLTAGIFISLCGCSQQIPECLKNPKTEYVVVEDYKRAEYEIPGNYRLIKNGVYAVLNEDDTVIGYMKLIEENGTYHWEQSSSQEAYR